MESNIFMFYEAKCLSNILHMSYLSLDVELNLKINLNYAII